MASGHSLDRVYNFFARLCNPLVSRAVRPGSFAADPFDVTGSVILITGLDLDPRICGFRLDRPGY